MNPTYFKNNDAIEWAIIKNLVENVKAGVDAYKRTTSDDSKIKEIAAKFTLDMLGEIGHADPTVYKTLFILYEDVFSEMFKLFVD